MEAGQVWLADGSRQLPQQDDEGHVALLPPPRWLDEAWPGRAKEKGEQAPQEVSRSRGVSVSLRDNVDGRRRTSTDVCGPSVQVSATPAQGQAPDQVASGRRGRNAMLPYRGSLLEGRSDARHPAAWRRPAVVQRGTRAPDRLTPPPSWRTVVGCGTTNPRRCSPTM